MFERGEEARVKTEEELSGHGAVAKKYQGQPAFFLNMINERGCRLYVYDGECFSIKAAGINCIRKLTIQDIKKGG